MRLSRSKIELFVRCPRCFYFDVVLKIKQPGSMPFTLNSEVDRLLKKEFDVHRAKQQPHPLMTAYGIEAVPFENENMDKWRNNFKGVSYLHPETEIEFFGAVDDIWVDKNGRLIVVDYKSTAKEGEVELTDSPWHDSYRRQMEIYQWLLANNGFEVSETGCFVYVNGRTDKEAFDARLEFRVKIITYLGNRDWIEGVVTKLAKVLADDRLPPPNKDCEFCRYRSKTSRYEIDGM
jgi:CRISPR/Cas system-associated exonuclease Cas4 (RecB family)